MFRERKRRSRFNLEGGREGSIRIGGGVTSLQYAFC